MSQLGLEMYSALNHAPFKAVDGAPLFEATVKTGAPEPRAWLPGTVVQRT